MVVQAASAVKINVFHLHLTDDQAWRVRTGIKFCNDTATNRDALPVFRYARLLTRANFDITAV